MEIVKLDDNWKPVVNSKKEIEADAVCIATGLTPLIELAFLAGCKLSYINELGGHIPIHNEYMETTVDGIYVAGDITGIEEANTAMEEGRLAGISVASSLGFYNEEGRKELTYKVWDRLRKLRSGPFGIKRVIGKEKIKEVFKSQ